MDLADGHLKVLQTVSEPGVSIYNLGTGQGVSVLEMVKCFIRVAGVGVPYRFALRRAGDLPAFLADAGKALSELGWRAERGRDVMMAIPGGGSPTTRRGMAAEASH